MKEEHQSIRIFENPILEFTTHVHPVVPLLVWGPVVATLLIRSVIVLKIPFSMMAVIAVSALFTWTLLEYTLHRYLLHMPVDTPFRKRMQFLMHGMHHEDPKDRTRLVMPPAPAVILATVCWFIIRAAIGPFYAQPFFGFFLTGYLAYDYLHFYMHFATPRNPVGKWLRNHHYKHHFATPDARWGVSSPLWDYIFRSNPETNTTPLHVVINPIEPAQVVPSSIRNHSLTSEKNVQHRLNI